MVKRRASGVETQISLLRAAAVLARLAESSIFGSAAQIQRRFCHGIVNFSAVKPVIVPDAAADLVAELVERDMLIVPARNRMAAQRVSPAIVRVGLDAMESLQ